MGWWIEMIIIIESNLKESNERQRASNYREIENGQINKYVNK